MKARVHRSGASKKPEDPRKSPGMEREHHDAAAQICHAPVSWMLGVVLVFPCQKGCNRTGKTLGRMKDLEWLL